jgi:hypothetical protein
VPRVPQKSRAKSLPFPRKLVLNQWVLSLFGVKEFGELKQHLTDDHLEGLDEDRVHRFHRALALHFPELPELPVAVLLEYDQNIVRHTERLNERRLTHGREPIVWKYFQYLSLLFTEIYLDRLFRESDELLEAVDAWIRAFNESTAPAQPVAPFSRASDSWFQLNKLAFWSATGSGKTLLMHANILQYRFYAERHGRAHELNKVILLTPNEGLSVQHLAEFEVSGISAVPFRKDGATLFEKHAVQVIEIHKLKDEMGDKTVAVEAFEGNNLVLIDEGHRGTTSGEEGAWLRFRNALCETGFSFEYSATFGQVGNAGDAIADGYARSILVDYSYKYFYGDGFGKDYRIFNLAETTSAADRELYLVACLLAFHEQLRLYLDRSMELAPFNIERPLWIFVGGKVTKELSSKESADVVEILLFLSRFVADREGSIERIGQVLDRGLTTSTQENPFADRFRYLAELKWTADRMFDDVLSTLFNAAGGGALHVENLKGAQGEIALRVGENEPFGVINVGDDVKLIKLCAGKGMPTGELEFGASLFHAINDSASTVNLLIGSKKFSEGWSS